MKPTNIVIILCASLFVWSGLYAQQQADYTLLSEQIRLDSIKQHYLHMGLPEEWAEKRAQAVFKSQRSVQTRNISYNPTPTTGSIWLDRDSITGAPSASHAHDFTPEEFIKDIFVRGGRKVSDHIIRNVTLISSSWEGSMTDTWNDKGFMGPFGGDAGTWTSDDRELLYFDHGDTTTMIPGWDGNPVSVFGMHNGFLLATGPGLTAEGENLNPWGLWGGYTDWITLWGGNIPAMLAHDPNLSPIAAPNTVETLTSLEFDFCSFTDSVSFKYIFSSDEFPDYANSDMNDAFGLFISGPGLTDAWGNSGDTINIARYPNGKPVTINNSNWGYANSYNTPGFAPLADAVSPEYHVPIYDLSEYMEYDGHSIVLTAKAKLQKGVWYHMKLAVGNVFDNQLGSGIFLQAGSFDLGTPESNVPRPYTKIEYDSIHGWNSLYANCDNSMILQFDPIGATGGEVNVWAEGDGAAFTYDPTRDQTFGDTITYELMPNDTMLTVHFNVSEDVKNASKMQLYSNMLPINQSDTTEVFNLYAKSKTELINYIQPTASSTGVLEVQITDGSPYLQRSIDGGYSWEFARDTLTGEPKPFTNKQISDLSTKEDACIIYREPNTCSSNDTLFISRSMLPPENEQAESDILRPYVKTKYDSLYGWYSLYANCDNTLVFNFDSVGATGGVIKVWAQGDGAAFTYDLTRNKTFGDTVTYELKPNDTTLTVRFKVSEDVKDASLVRFFSNIPPNSQNDTTKVFNIYAKSKTELIRYIRPTASYAGVLEVQTTYGSPFLQRSIDGGHSWEFARDTLTGEPKPFTNVQIAQLGAEEEAYILFREPNTCCSYETLYISHRTLHPDITRVVTMPAIPGAIVDKEPGEHVLYSKQDFVFTITPVGNNVNAPLTITTSRTSVPDSEGVIVEMNRDGSYTVTIREVQEPIEVFVDFATASASVESNRIRANGSQVYIQSDESAQVRIYAISGALVQSVTIGSGETTGVSLPKGFYFVVIDGRTSKVIIR